MKNRIFIGALAFLAGLGIAQNACAQGTAFTYQGRLTDNGTPAEGTYDFQFTIFAVSSGGSPLTNTVAVNDLAISDGLFTVLLDFGAGIFSGAERFLEISLRAGNSSGLFRALTPRQRISATPYAIRAETIEMGAVVNPSFIGTTTETPLELFVNNERVLRFESDIKGVNLIGGFSGNTANGSVGVTIAGGGAPGNVNAVSAPFGTVSGGLANSVGGTRGVIGGGQENTANSDYSFIGGGQKNATEVLDLFETNGLFAVIAGGAQNTNRGKGAAIAGGQVNTANGAFSTVAGGFRNHAGGDYSFAAGRRAKANHDGSFVWADSTDADFASGGNNQFLIRASGGMSIGATDPINRLTVAGAGAFNSLAAAAITLNNTAANGHDWEWHALDDGRMQFADRSLGASRMVIQTNGNVGMGVTQPSGELHVGSSGGVSPLSLAARTVLVENSSENGRAAFLALAGTGSSDSTNRVELQLEANEGERRAIIGTTSNHEVEFRQDNSARMTIWTNGNVGIGTTTPNFLLEVDGSAGKPGGGSWSNSSDERLKKNIRTLAGALDKLLALRGVSFEYIDPKKIHELSGERMGLIAQEVEKVFPDWVETGPNGYKRVTVRGLEALVVEALRQLRLEKDMELKGLEARLAQQEKEIAELKRLMKLKGN